MDAKDREMSWLKNKIMQLPDDFTGNIQINFFRGKIGVVNIQQSFKPAEE